MKTSEKISIEAFQHKPSSIVKIWMEKIELRRRWRRERERRGENWIDSLVHSEKLSEIQFSHWQSSIFNQISSRVHSIKCQGIALTFSTDILCEDTPRSLIELGNFLCPSTSSTFFVLSEGNQILGSLISTTSRSQIILQSHRIKAELTEFNSPIAMSAIFHGNVVCMSLPISTKRVCRFNDVDVYFRAWKNFLNFPPFHVKLFSKLRREVNCASKTIRKS